jgi:hypothetical protein
MCGDVSDCVAAILRETADIAYEMQPAAWCRGRARGERMDGETHRGRTRASGRRGVSPQAS